MFLDLLGTILSKKWVIYGLCTPFGQFEPVTERISKNFLFGYKHAYFINRDNFN
jgi:hypothetical protein